MAARLRNKLLLGAVGISMLAAATSMLAVAWLIDRQHLEQSNTLLLNASNVIKDSLDEHKDKLLNAARQLAGQKNLGSTIWYLEQYSRSNLDRETLFNTYQQLVRDTRKLGHVAEASKVALYDGRGALVAFALLEPKGEQAGYVERGKAPVFRVEPLQADEDLNRKNLQDAHAVSGITLELDGRMPQQDSVYYAVADGKLVIKSVVPILGEAFNAGAARWEIKQLGVVVMEQPIDQHVTDRFARLTDARIRIVSVQGRGGPGSPGSSPDGEATPGGTAFNEISIDGEDYYQSLIPLNNAEQTVGEIAVLYSKQVVRTNTLEMIRTLGLIAAASLTLIFLFAWYFANSISRPLTALSRIFLSVTTGKTLVVPGEELAKLKQQETRHDELGDLTQSFIAMGDAVNRNIQQINEINASLEQKIRGRTAALAASEQESRTMIENSPDTIARYDRECRRIYANPAFGKMTPGGLAALLGKKPSEFPGGPNLETYEEKIREVFATGKDAQFELKWLDKDGAEICSHIRLTPERDLAGEVATVLGVGRDISELNAYRSELKRKETEKTRFLAAAGHDMRQPLAAASLFIDALGFTELSPEQGKIVHRLEQAMSTFNGLLEALLDISKLDAGMTHPEYASVSVIDLCGWLEQNFAPLAAKKGLGFKLYFPMKEALAVRTDIGLAKSALMNLVSNAIKFTPAGTILVSARRRGGRVLFQVWDTGIGIEDKHLQHIFDEFYQVDNPQRDRSGGLGLGLSIAKRALTLLDSRITCRSQPGRGSVFGFSLPLDAASGAVVMQAAAADAQSHAIDRGLVAGKQFVVVENDTLVAQALADSLEGMGAKVKCYDSAEDALLHAGEDHDRAYIVDYMLGGTLNGIQFLNRLQAKFNSPVRAVLVTGDTSPSFIKEAESGAWPVLYKPVSMSRLIPALLGG